MTPRMILYTGKGGVGKTSVAAATARACALAGKRTLIISTDPAHSLSESLQVTLGGDEPIPVPLRPDGAAASAAASAPAGAADGDSTPAADAAASDDSTGSTASMDSGEYLLYGLEIDAHTELERRWHAAQSWLSGLLSDRGIDRISAQELTVPPGMDELFSLLRLQEQAHENWDVIIVDCAPTGETLRLLSFPEAARWWLAKIFPMERALLAAAAPIARGMLDISLPDAEAMADVHRLSQSLLAMDTILRDHEHTSVRLVMTPDRMVVGEAMRSFTYLNLYNYLTDAVIVNRVFPAASGKYFAAWRKQQEQSLELVDSAFQPLPVLRARFFDTEVRGAETLDRLGAEIFGSGASGREPWALIHDTITQQLEADADGARLRIAIPFVRKEEITLKQVGDELLIITPSLRRTIILPSSVAALSASGASYEDGALEVRFTHV
jgi:arsenite-transporting ATPase